MSYARKLIDEVVQQRDTMVRNLLMAELMRLKLQLTDAQVALFVSLYPDIAALNETKLVNAVDVCYRTVSKRKMAL